MMKMNAQRRLHGLWKANLVVFALLFTFILAYFWWQVAQSRRAFETHVNEHAQLVTDVVGANITNAGNSRQVVEQIVTTFLANSARFVAYLDAVEPFNADELAAYAEENGLCGLWIQRQDQVVMAPDNWFALPEYRLPDQDYLIYRRQQHQYVLVWPDADQQRVIVLGLPAQPIEQLQRQMGVPQLLKALSQLSGIAQLRLEPVALNPAEPQTLITGERRLPLGDSTLILEVESDSLGRRIGLLWREFFTFSGLLLLAGLVLSWLLYRYQNRHVQDLWQLQHELALQREDASLGRAASSISHEIRNPLNAISMGLQRLQIEAVSLDEDQQQLLEAMREAVKRTNDIVYGLQRYAQPLKPTTKPVALDLLVQRVVDLYRPQLEEQQVHLNCQLQPLVSDGDDALLGQLVENLIKNALEAQRRGGFISVNLMAEASQAVLRIENRAEVDAEELEGLFDPYFTTKTRGTGLGLSMARKIAVAHGGRIELSVVEDDCFRVTVWLPLQGLL